MQFRILTLCVLLLVGGCASYWDMTPPARIIGGSRHFKHGPYGEML